MNEWGLPWNGTRRTLPSTTKGGRFGALALCSVMAAFAACAPSGPEPELRLGFVTNNSAEFWLAARRGCGDARRQLPGVQVEFRMPAHGSAAEQRQILEELLAQGVEGVAVSPVDPARQIDWINAVAGRVLLVTHDSDAPASRRAFYVGSDNLEAGRQAGELIRGALPEGGRVMAFVGTLEAENARQRLEGVRERLEGSGVELVGVETDGGDPAQAETNALAVLAGDQEVDLLLGLWSYNGAAILRAVRQSGRGHLVQIVCFDPTREILDAIASGEIHGAILQQPGSFCLQAVRLMARRLRPNRYGADERDLLPPDSKVYVPTMVVTRQNVDQYRRDALR